MAILKLKDKPRSKPYRVRVAGQVKMFRTLEQAKRWERFCEDTVLMTGLPPTIEELKRHTVGDLVDRYLKEKTPHKGSAVNERTVLKKFRKRSICSLSLAAVKKEHAAKYRDERLQETWRKKPITPRTVRREVNTLHHIFVVAREEWGFENLKNPFDGLTIRGSMYRRTRQLNPGELDRLLDASKRCLGLNKFYVPLAILLAIDTGMRLQEIFNLRVSDINPIERTIVIRKSKTDHLQDHPGRTIVLPVAALLLFSNLVQKLAKDFGADQTVRFAIFPLTQRAFQQAWADTVKRADVKDLHFHDLRREAGSRFEDAGLTGGERDLMLGHSSKDMRSLYSRGTLKSIQDKLDKSVFNGKTWNEVKAEIDARTWTEHPTLAVANVLPFPLRKIDLLGRTEDQS